MFAIKYLLTMPIRNNERSSIPQPQSALQEQCIKIKKKKKLFQYNTVATRNTTVLITENNNVGYQLALQLVWMYVDRYVKSVSGSINRTVLCV